MKQNWNQIQFPDRKTQKINNIFNQTYAYGHSFNLVRVKRLGQTARLSPDINSQKQRIKQMVFTPFQRIKRVEKLILSQKQHQQQSNRIQEDTNYIKGFKPQFKIKSKDKTKFDKTFEFDSIKLEGNHINLPQQQKRQRISSTLNSFQDNFKKRQRLNRRSIKKKQEVSLIGMLNRISDNPSVTPRYNPRIYEQPEQLNSFFTYI